MTPSAYGLIYGEEFNLPYVYQPVFGQEGTTERERPSTTRLHKILDADRTFNNSRILTSSICDFGSNLGHFSMSLEKAGCTGSIVGFDAASNFVDASNHIAKSVGSKCTFSRDITPAEVYLLLSVTHHIMTDSWYTGMQHVFDRMVAFGAHTIYVEQATHLEWLPWAAKLRCSGNVYLHFMKALDKITRGKFNIRLVGTERNDSLDTVRPIYQLKKKVSIPLVVDGKTFEAYDHWGFPFLGVKRDVPSANYYYAKDDSGGDFFIKQGTWGHRENKWFPPETKIDGILFIDILRFGMLPFYDLKKVSEQIYEIMESKHIILDDCSLWNILVTEDSTVRLIDTNDSPPTTTTIAYNQLSLMAAQILLDTGAKWKTISDSARAELDKVKREAIRE